MQVGTNKMQAGQYKTDATGSNLARVKLQEFSVAPGVNDAAPSPGLTRSRSKSAASLAFVQDVDRHKRSTKLPDISDPRNYTNQHELLVSFSCDFLVTYGTPLCLRGNRAWIVFDAAFGLATVTLH